jgi:hypothetical protein
MFTRIVLFSVLMLAQLLVISCRDDEEDQGGNGGGGSVPAGMTRLYGDVRDANGQPLADVALHVIYDVTPGAAIQDVAVPSSTTIYYLGMPLTTECNGNTPIPDGIMVKIFWDNDSDGADPDDPQPPVCEEPPDCITGPLGTVNLNEFPFNGAHDLEGAAGTFYTQRNLVTSGDVLVPNRFYFRVYCTDGNVLWQSDQVYDIPQGPSELFISGFTCTECNGIPVPPAWSLEQNYPNPAADSAHIWFGLFEAATALLTIREERTGNVDTLLNEALASGSHTLDFDLQARANGVYQYRLNASTYSESRLLLKNEENVNALPLLPSLDVSDGGGTYSFDTAAETNIALRTEENVNQGAAILDHLRIIAIKPGYAIADTSIAIVSAESLRVDLIMHP